MRNRATRAKCTTRRRRPRPHLEPRLFLNLVHNAIKFTPAKGAITIRTANDAPDLLRVDVVDTGIGVAPGDTVRIFEAFEQTGDDVSRRSGGLGMGLAICKALVEAHGRIAARSEGRNRGATFTVELLTVTAERATAAAHRA